MIFDNIVRKKSFPVKIYRLTGLALFLIHYNIEIDLDETIRRFAGLHPRRMELASSLSEWLRNPPKEEFRGLKSKKFQGEHVPGPPLEACAFGARLGNRSVFNLDPRLQYVPRQRKVFYAIYDCLLYFRICNFSVTLKASLNPGPSCSTSSDKQISFHSIAQIGFPNTFSLDSDLPSGERYSTFKQPEPGQGDRFSKDPETFRARRQIFKSKPLNISTIPSPQTSPNCFDNWCFTCIIFKKLIIETFILNANPTNT